MSGTGGPSPAEAHLGDRLAALVDGELGHDARERVLAHLATCGKCKAEADAQRELKSVFAEMAPPGPSDGLLARLQGLPGGDPGAPTSRLGEGGLGRGDFGRGMDGGFGGGSGAASFGYVPSGAHAISAVPRQPHESGFRIHGGERSGAGAGSPRRRFAFAAAGAVSLAAFALSGALPLEAAVTSATGRGEGSPLSVSPAAEETLAAGREAQSPTARGSRDRAALMGALQGRPTPAAVDFTPAAAALPVSYATPLMGGGERLSPLIAPAVPNPSGSGTGSAGTGTPSGSFPLGYGHPSGGAQDGPRATPTGGGPLPSALASPASPAKAYPAPPLPPLEPKRPLLSKGTPAAR